MGGNRSNAMSFLHTHLSTVERGALGTLATTGSVAVSMDANVICCDGSVSEKK